MLLSGSHKGRLLYSLDNVTTKNLTLPENCRGLVIIEIQFLGRFAREDWEGGSPTAYAYFNFRPESFADGDTTLIHRIVGNSGEAEVSGVWAITSGFHPYLNLRVYERI